MQEKSLIDELESAVRTASPENRVKCLRRITDLFLHDANRLNDSQIEVFDDVLCLLAERIERTALAELGKRLAPVDTSPIRVIKRLAQDDDITVATPVLTGSKRLTTADLVHIAKTKSQAHLLAISERSTLEPALTEVLLVRGEQKVVSSLAKNAGALFSTAGYNRLVERAEGDDDLSAIVGLRKDLPRSLLQELLRRATDAAIAKILSVVSPERRKEIELVVTKIGKTIAQSTERDYGDAERNVAALVSSGKLDEGALLGFVQRRQQDEFIVALARLSSIPVGTIAQLLNGHRNDAVLLPCKAAGLSWTAVDFILHDRLVGQSTIAETIEVARRDYAKLTSTTAHRALRFMSIRGTVK